MTYVEIIDQDDSVSPPYGPDVLTRTRLAWLQRRQARSSLVMLASECRDAYRFALALLHPAKPEPENEGRLNDYAVLDLLYAWDGLCCWYRENLFNPQLDLFTCPWNTELDRWHYFIRDRVFRLCLKWPEYVRAVLIASGVIPADPNRVLFAVETFTQMIRDLEEEIEHAAQRKQDDRCL